jgi:hypothetical protein
MKHYLGMSAVTRKSCLMKIPVIKTRDIVTLMLPLCSGDSISFRVIGNDKVLFTFVGVIYSLREHYCLDPVYIICY